MSEPRNAYRTAADVLGRTGYAMRQALTDELTAIFDDCSRAESYAAALTSAVLAGDNDRANILASAYRLIEKGESGTAAELLNANGVTV